jgi:hypothetical protein
MTSFKTITAALVLSALSAFAAAPASAWQAVDEPGAYSFYHPNADVLNVGPSPSPSASSSNAMASTLREAPAAGTQMSVRPRHGTAVKRY